MNAAYTAAITNLREAHAAMQLIREAVETLGPVGAMRSSEYIACAIAPTFTEEALEIVRGIQRIAEHHTWPLDHDGRPAGNQT